MVPDDLVYAVTATPLTPSHADRATKPRARVAPAFWSDWASGRGATDAALRDTGKSLPWSALDNNWATDLAVVSASGLGFPTGMANVLRHTFQPGVAGQRASFVRLVNGFPAPTIGQTLYVRFYFRADYLDEGTAGHDNSHHPFEGDNSGTVKSVILMKPGNNLNGTFPIRFLMDEAATGHFNQAYLQPNSTAQNLTKGIVYRIEIAFTILDGTYLRPRFRLYGADDSTLLFPDGATGCTKMVDLTGASLSSLADTTYPYFNLNWLCSWELGNNGGSLGPFSTACADYFGGLCIRTDDWCGAYAAVTG